MDTDSDGYSVKSEKVKWVEILRFALGFFI